jgi:hypothetical protein
LHPLEKRRLFTAHANSGLMQRSKRQALIQLPDLRIRDGIRRMKATGADVVLIDPQFAPKVTARASWFAS